MKKILALVMALVLMCLAFAGCGANKSDLEKVKKEGKIVVGITSFAPMDYKEKGSSEWIGFDADMAKGFAKYLGVEVEFHEIKWENKVLELENGTIDCVWNGMTLTDEVTSAMSCSNPYCDNAQIVILPKDVADKYKNVDDLKADKTLNFAVESGSAGFNVAKENGFKYTEIDSQAKALTEVKSRTCNAAIIDSLMAVATVGEGTSYEDLAYTVKLNSEEYGVGFRKGSDLTAEINKFFEQSNADGTTLETAEKYGIQELIITQ